MSAIVNQPRSQATQSAQEQRLPALAASLSSDPSARDIMIAVPAIKSGENGKVALMMLSARQDAPCLAVIDHMGKPIGMVSLENLAPRLPNQYFHALHENRPVDLLMDSSPLMVDVEDSLKSIGDRIAHEAPNALRTGFLILEGDRYAGIGTGLDVLTATLRLAEKRMKQAENARALALEATLSKSRFLASMSHELRTPLNAIVGYANLLRDEFKDSGQDQAAADLKTIEDASLHLLSLINTVLDISKIEAGRMEIHCGDFSVVHLVKEVEGIIRGVAMSRGNEFAIRIDTSIDSIWSDRARLRQCLINLVGNAAKFTENGSIQLAVSDLEPGWIRFSVSDTGIGMTEAQMARLFAPFSQADESIGRLYGGSGLGLAIVKSFLDLLGGSVTVESSPGCGSNFTINLPTGRSA